MNPTIKQKSNVYPKNKIIPSSYILDVPHINSKLPFSSERIFVSRPKSNSKTKYISSLNNYTNTFSGGNIVYEANNMKNIFEGMSTMKKTRNPEISNSLSTYQKLLLREQEKNKEQSKNIILLNNRINDLECQLIGKSYNSKQLNNNYNNNIQEDIIKLKKENQELKTFKQKVYEFSMKYDEINENILNCVKSLDSIIKILNNNSFSQNYEINIGDIQKTSNCFKEILDYLINFITVKQDEYNSLLKQERLDNLKLKKEIEKLNNINNNIAFSNKNDNNINDGFYKKKKIEFKRCNSNKELNYDRNNCFNIKNNKNSRTFENFYRINIIHNNNQQQENRQNDKLERLKSIKNSIKNIQSKNK